MPPHDKKDYHDDADADKIAGRHSQSSLKNEQTFKNL